MSQKAAWVICQTGVFCSNGLSSQHAAAEAWAGHSSRVTSSVLVDYRPLMLGMLPLSVFPALHPQLAAIAALPSQYRRLLCLADNALREAAANQLAGRPVPLFIAVPDTLAGRPWNVDIRTLCAHLQTQSGVALDAVHSALFVGGDAEVFAATAAAQAHAARTGGKVLVGGIDTFMDLARLAQLDREERLSRPEISDGFVPGEGAAFLMLEHRSPRRGEVVLGGVGLAVEVGHRYAEPAHSGEGLSDAIEATRTSNAPTIESIYTGLTGESFILKEWKVALIRHHDLIALHAEQETPVDKTGHLGAALGAYLLVLAATNVRLQRSLGPILCWAASDHGNRGAATVLAAAA